METTQLQFVKSFDELAGARIERAVPLGTFYSSRVALVLDDGRLAVIAIDRGYESCDDELALETSLEYFDDSDKVKVGLMDKADYDSREQARREAEARRQEANERAQYEALKRKFG